MELETIFVTTQELMPAPYLPDTFAGHFSHQLDREMLVESLNNRFGDHHFGVVRDPRTLNDFIVIRERDTRRRIAIVPAR